MSPARFREESSLDLIQLIRAYRFSIVITSYNQRAFIRDAVDSALHLRNTNREVIVVDDASTDGSQQLLVEYGDAIRLVSLQTNLEKGGARNQGAAVATGDYLLFLDGDDALMPWALQIYERIVQAKTPKLILCPMSWFENTLPPLLSANAPHAIQIVEYEDYMRKDRSFGVSASSLVIERQSFQNVQGWARDRFVMEDQDLVLRLGDSGRTVQLLSPPTILRRRHAGQTINQVAPFIDALHRMIREEGSGRYPGGQYRHFERSALFGGLVFFWANRALRARLYWDALKLLARGWTMVLAAILRRLGVVVKGRHLRETIDL